MPIDDIDPRLFREESFDPELFCAQCARANGRIETTTANGSRALVTCPCQAKKLPLRRWLQATKGIEGLREYSFENLNAGSNIALMRAKAHARQFCEQWPVNLDGKGMIFTGPCGQGKTHLAVAMLRFLILERGVKRGGFVNLRRELQKIRDTYDEGATTREETILDRLMSLDVLVLDELGTEKPTEWVQNKIADIIDTRMNRGLTAIITTNFELAPGGPNSLGERVGPLCYSRICQMCVHCDIVGDDYRQGPGRATVEGLLLL